jgi:hypothetical protein
MGIPKAYPENPCTSVLGSVKFLQHMEAKYSFITDSWYTDMGTWREISRDACRTPDGQLLTICGFIG